jgi:tetratricopeptide (TPR) repeat protein
MASASQPDPTGRKPLSPVQRRRLQQMLESANKSASQGNFDYASEMYTQCVLGDPGNRVYAMQFLNNLFRKYDNNKKGSKMAGFSGMKLKTYIKKSSMQKDWAGVLKSGVEMLKLNPWDVSTLVAMAQACDLLEHADSQLAYLKTALDVNMKDVEVNRLCGRALARTGQFDQAVACWQRVVAAKPGDPEGTRAIGDLAVEKTISHGRYDEAESTKDVKPTHADDPRPGEKVLTPEQKLEKAIAKNPAEVSNYVDLADLHIRQDKMQEAEDILAKALEVSGGEVTIRERYEDTQLRRGRQQLTIAEKRAEEQGTEQAVELAKKMKKELNRLEMDVYRSRCDRYPTNMNFKIELGLRLKGAGQYAEAIQLLQQARGDSKRKALVHLELGECFQHIKQFKLALNNYEDAVAALNDHNSESGKLALYRAGVIAFHLKNRELAEKYLTQLAEVDFGYRDVAKWLDKMARDGQND